MEEDGPLRPIVELAGIDAAYRDRSVLRGIDLAVGGGRAGRDRRPERRRQVDACSGSWPGRSRPTAGSVRLGGDADRCARPDGRSRAGWRSCPRSRPCRSPRGSRRSSGSAGCPTRTRSAAAGRPTRPPSPRRSTGSGLGRLLGRDARELSLGERQLVLLALAVAQAAPILVLDEPTVHLDLRHQVETMDLLVDLNERDGTTVVAVLHDLGLAGHFFPRLVLLAGGEIVADGPPGAGPRRRSDPGGVRGRPRLRPSIGRPGAVAGDHLSPRPSTRVALTVRHPGG